MNNRTIELISKNGTVACIRATDLEGIVHEPSTGLVLAKVRNQEAQVVQNDYKSLRTQWENALSYDAVGVFV